MNIFALSKDPREAAQMMIDKHVIKMPTESCQMLHTNALYFMYVDHYNSTPSLRELKQFHTDIASNLMKPAMLNHPSTIWARETKGNWDYLYEHALSLCEEYTLRYGREHGSYQRILDTPDYPYKNDTSALTPVTIAMADQYRLDPIEFYNTARVQYGIEYDEWDFVIASYRNYYLEGKWRFAEWRNDRRPEWWPVNHINIKWNEVFTRMNEQNNFSIPLKMLPLEEE